MKKVYNYFFVEPLLEIYKDNDYSIKPKSTILVDKEQKTYEVAIFAEGNRIYMIRIMVPDVENEIISEDDINMVQSLKEHMKSILRVNYNTEVSFFQNSIRTVADDDKPYRMGVKLNLFSNDHLNIKDISSLYGATINIKHQMRLMSDSQDNNIPYHCRLLSLYKLLELEFKEKGKWKKQEFNDFLGRFEDDFNKLKLSNRELKNYIHDIRDRCAHIKSNKDILYVIELDNKSQTEVKKFLGFLTEMCAILINEKYGNKTLKFGTIKLEPFKKL